MTKTVEIVLETDERGDLHVPRAVLGDAVSGTPLKLSIETEALTKEPQPRWGPRWARMTREERLQDVQEWLQCFRDEKSPGLSRKVISRDTIYD